MEKPLKPKSRDRGGRKVVHYFLWTAMIGFLAGCSATPDRHVLQDASRSFPAGTIIASQVEKPITFDTLLSDLSKQRIVYIGEKHTNKAHHAVQLKIIEALYQQNRNLIVGMEMFDRSYQHVLDAWVAGDLETQEFLKRVHWYANWRYDFSLYSDILKFVKDNGIKLIALNIPFNIPSKIRVGGLDYLSDYEKGFLPTDVDTDVANHREELKRVFARHNFKGDTEFEDFYMAQCMVDEAMAEAIVRNLDAKQMVVLAGNGHIQYKYGIPNRAFRRARDPFRTICLAQTGQTVALDIADYIWVTTSSNGR